MSFERRFRRVRRRSAGRLVTLSKTFVFERGGFRGSPALGGKRSLYEHTGDRRIDCCYSQKLEPFQRLGRRVDYGV